MAVFKIFKFAKSSKSFKSRNFENLKFEGWRLYRWSVRICACEVKRGVAGEGSVKRAKGREGRV